MVKELGHQPDANKVIDALLDRLWDELIFGGDGRIVATVIGAVPAALWPEGMVRHTLSRLAATENNTDLRIDGPIRRDLAPNDPWPDEMLNVILASLSDENAQLFARLLSVNDQKFTPRDPWPAGMIDALLVRLNKPSESASFRRLVAEALGDAPEKQWSGPVVVALLARLLDSDEANNVREAAARALGNAPAEYWSDPLVGNFLDILQNEREDLGVVAGSAEALGNAPDEYWSVLVVAALLGRLVPDEEGEAGRRASIAAIGKAPDSYWSKVVVDTLLRLLRDGDEEWSIRNASVEALGSAPAGPWTQVIIRALLDLLNSERGSEALSQQAAWALGNVPVGSWTLGLVDSLLRQLRDSDSSYNEQGSAATALGGLPAGPWSDGITKALRDLVNDKNTEQELRWWMAIALAHAQGGPFIEISEFIVSHLGPDSQVEILDLWALANAMPVDGGRLVPLLGAIHEVSVAEVPTLRAIAHILAGGDGDGERLLAWLGKPGKDARLLNLVRGKPDAAYRELELLFSVREQLADREETIAEASSAVATIIGLACDGTARSGQQSNEAVTWLPDDFPAWFQALWRSAFKQPCWNSRQAKLVGEIRDWIQPLQPTAAIAIDGQLQGSPWIRAVIKFLLGWAGLAVFCAVLLISFPQSRRVQAVIFYHPWAKKYLSLGVIPFVLHLMPSVRRRVLLPFRVDLLGEARLDDLDALGFFGRGRAHVEGKQGSLPVTDVLSRIDGVTVLYGDAGLGKTSVLRWIASQDQGIAVFLHARDCADGVAEAIARRLKGFQDEAFVRGLIHTGDMLVLIDGLNEVAAATHEAVRSFGQRFSCGRIVIATQPIQWNAPDIAKTVELEKFSRQEAESFLLSRPVAKDRSQSINGAAYENAVKNFMTRSIDEAPTEVDREATLSILSNPFDLTFLAELIALNASPTARGVVDEAFRLADEGPGESAYRKITGRPFPLVEFGKHAIAMRLDVRTAVRN